MSASDRPTERREVRSDDPSLSPEANRLLTAELRRVVGSPVVEVPPERPRVEHDRHGGRAGWIVALADNRLALGMTALGGVVFGAILSLVTGSWWLLPLVVVVFALATTLVVVLLLQLTTETEHLSPAVAARLEDEGVGDPDKLFSDLVHEFAPASTAAKQRTAQTPSPHRGRSVGP